MKKEIILIGGGGHCKACIDVIEQENKFKIAGIIDVKERVGEKVLGYEIIGVDADLNKIRKKYKYALITMGQVKPIKLRYANDCDIMVTSDTKLDYNCPPYLGKDYYNNYRLKMYKKLKKFKYKLPVIVSPRAYLARDVKVGEGTIIMHDALINSNVSIGKNTIINTKALIEHDSKVGNHCHLATNVVINGNCKIFSGTFIGSCAVLTPFANTIGEPFIKANELKV